MTLDGRETSVNLNTKGTVPVRGPGEGRNSELFFTGDIPESLFGPSSRILFFQRPRGGQDYPSIVRCHNPTWRAEETKRSDRDLHHFLEKGEGSPFPPRPTG